MPEADPPNFIIYTVRLRHPARCSTVSMHRSNPLPSRPPRRCRGGGGSSRWRLALPVCPRSSGPIRTPRIVEEGPAAPRNRPERPALRKSTTPRTSPASPRTIPVIIRARSVGRRSGDDKRGVEGGRFLFAGRTGERPLSHQSGVILEHFPENPEERRRQAAGAGDIWPSKRGLWILGTGPENDEAAGGADRPTTSAAVLSVKPLSCDFNRFADSRRRR